MDNPFGYHPDPEIPGWLLRRAAGDPSFNRVFGDIQARVEDERSVRLRVMAIEPHLNPKGTIHGGLLMALADHAMFVCPLLLGKERIVGGSTIDLASQFLAPGRAGLALDVTVELMHETGRMVFTRGLIEQDGGPIFSFTSTMRKASAPR